MVPNKNSKDANPLPFSHEQTAAMEQVNLLVEGLERQKCSRLFQALRALQRIDIKEISNPYAICFKLLGGLPSLAAAGEDYGLKCQIAAQLRRFGHRMYSLGQRVEAKDKKTMVEGLDKELGWIGDEKHSPGNALRFELETFRAMVKALPDTNNLRDSWGEAGVGLFTALRDRE